MDMINRMKQNRALRPSNRPKFKENNREKIYSTEKKLKRPNFKTVDEKELNKLNTQIRKRAKSEQKKEQLIYGILIVFGLIILIGLMVWLD